MMVAPEILLPIKNNNYSKQHQKHFTCDFYEKGDQLSDISPRIGDLCVYFVSLVVGPKTITVFGWTKVRSN